MHRQIDIGSGRLVMITDDPDPAKARQWNGPVIGIGEADGFSFTAESEEALDQDYLELVYCRFYGLARTVLETDHWRIREASEGDIEALMALYEDEQVRRYLENPLEGQTNGSKEDWRQWLEAYRKYVYMAEEPAMWIIERTDGTFLGRIGLSWRDADGELPAGYYAGYALMPGERKKGLAAEAASRMIDHCIDYWQIPDVYLLCDSENIPSAAAAIRSGFSRFAAADRNGKLLSGFENVIEHSLNDILNIGTGKLLLFSWK